MEGLSADEDVSNKKSDDVNNDIADKYPISDFSIQAEKRLKIDVSYKNSSDETMLTETFEKDENADSGISVEKSESTSSDDPMTSAKNENVTPEDDTTKPSTSNSTTVKEEVKKNKSPRGRFYRMHRTMFATASDSDDDTQMDSDDTTVEITESASILDFFAGIGVDTSRPRTELPVLSSESNSLQMENIDENDSNSSHQSNDTYHHDSGSNIATDSDDWSDMENSPQNENDENSHLETPQVLLKRKPNHTWHVIKELVNRERGTVFKTGRSGRSDVLFEQRFYGSLHTVERLELMYKLNKHKGCVNSINFHPKGNLLVSGSDDLNIIVWDWSTNTCLQTIKSGHKANIFQSKFLHLNSSSQLNIVSCARDGQVRLLQIPSSGGSIFKRRLAQHARPAHKLYVSPAEPHVVISSGEDGQVMLSDVREEATNKLLKVRNNEVSVALYSVAGHPLDVNELCVAGRDCKVMIYDRRKAGQNAEPVRTYCPEFFLRSPEVGSNKTTKKGKCTSLYVTCAVYNHNGSEILASYNDDDIYLFDTITDNDHPPGSHGFTYKYRYSGHRNCATFKGVSFFGPQSEFVVSGSDCGNIYIWDKKSEAIVQWMMGDEGGIVNSIECHPRCPILATSGLDNDIKIWVPSNESDPTLQGLKEVVVENNRAQLSSPLTFLPGLYGVWGRDLFRRDAGERRDSDGEESLNEPAGSADFDGHACRPF